MQQAFGDGFRWVMVVCAMLLFAGAAISFFELSSRPASDGSRRGGGTLRRPARVRARRRSDRRSYGAGFARSLTVTRPYVSAVSAVTTNEFVSLAAE